MQDSKIFALFSNRFDILSNGNVNQNFLTKVGKFDRLFSDFSVSDTQVSLTDKEGQSWTIDIVQLLGLALADSSALANKQIRVGGVDSSIKAIGANTASVARTKVTGMVTLDSKIKQCLKKALFEYCQSVEKLIDGETFTLESKSFKLPSLFSSDALISECILEERKASILPAIKGKIEIANQSSEEQAMTGNSHLLDLPSMILGYALASDCKSVSVKVDTDTQFNASVNLAWLPVIASRLAIYGTVDSASNESFTVFTVKLK